MAGGQPSVAAFLLHRRRFGDTSLLVDLLTETRGRVVAVARGALRRAGHSPREFCPLLVGLRGRGEVLSLAGSESVGSAFQLRGRALYCGLYLNELLLKLLPRDESVPIVFASYLRALGELAQGDDMEPVLRNFELDLLAETGVLSLTGLDADDNPLDAGRYYHYRPEQGLVPTGLGASAGDAVSGWCLLAMQRRDFRDRQVRRESLRLLRQLIAEQLGGRTLKSRELFRMGTEDIS